MAEPASEASLGQPGPHGAPERALVSGREAAAAAVAATDGAVVAVTAPAGSQLCKHQQIGVPTDVAAQAAGRDHRLAACLDAGQGEAPTAAGVALGVLPNTGGGAIAALQDEVTLATVMRHAPGIKSGGQPLASWKSLDVRPAEAAAAGVVGAGPGGHHPRGLSRRRTSAGPAPDSPAADGRFTAAVASVFRILSPRTHLRIRAPGLHAAATPHDAAHGAVMVGGPDAEAGGAAADAEEGATSTAHSEARAAADEPISSTTCYICLGGEETGELAPGTCCAVRRHAACEFEWQRQHRSKWKLELRTVPVPPDAAGGVPAQAQSASQQEQPVALSARSVQAAGVGQAAGPVAPVTATQNAMPVPRPLAGGGGPSGAPTDSVVPQAVGGSAGTGTSSASSRAGSDALSEASSSAATVITHASTATASPGAPAASIGSGTADGLSRSAPMDEPGTERWVHLPCTVCRQDWKVLRLTDPELGLTDADVALIRDTWAERYDMQRAATRRHRTCIAIQIVAILTPLAVIIWAVYIMVASKPTSVGTG
jgi:hypothetical protein